MSTAFAPIVLFAYNRPRHTFQVLKALAANAEAKESSLFIYCDGAKEGAGIEQLEQIKQVREFAKAEKRFKEVIVYEQDSNLGLASSIIKGVTEIVKKYGNIIVIEDDIVVSKYFLKFMNDALIKYEKEEKVICISGYIYPIEKLPELFFIKGADCWGWATWKRGWDLFEADGQKLLRELEDKKRISEFDFSGNAPYTQMLKDQISKANNSWAIRWYASAFLKNKLTLYPGNTLVNNIGLDGSGTHSETSNLSTSPLPLNPIHLNNIPIEQNDLALIKMKLYFKNQNSPTRTYTEPTDLFYLTKKILKKIIPPILLSRFKPLKTKEVEPKQVENWLGDFSSWEEAKKLCSGYESEIILEKCKNALLKVKNGEAVYERDSVIFDTIQYSWGLLAGMERVALDNGNNLSVLDFGGSLGSTYFQNKHFLDNLNSAEWSIVEQPHFVACGKENFENDQLQFYHTIPECLENKKPDVILLSSVIQYMEKPFELLEQVNQLGLNYIIFDRTSFINQTDNLLMIQKVPAEIYEASYPIWFFNMDKIITSLSNYTLLTKFDCASDNDELIKDNIMASWKGLIFKKK